jgi:hypothetical protein
MANNNSKYYDEFALMEADINGSLDDLVSEFKYHIKKDSSSDHLDKITPLLIAGFFVAYKTILSNRNANIAQISGSYEQKKIEGMLTKLGGSQLVTNYRNALSNSAEDIKKTLWTRKIPVDSRTLTDRMEWVKKGATKTVRNIIATGTREGINTQELAKRIEQYIKPGVKTRYVSPYAWARGRFQSIKLTDIKDIPKGSVSYQAHLIARTEGAWTARQIKDEYYSDKPYVKGWEWKVSRFHKIVDICDDWAHANPYPTLESMPKDHPNGLCDQIPILMSDKEFAHYLKTGEEPKPLDFSKSKEFQNN